MHLEKLNLVNFKNYGEISLSLNSRINLIVGRNGAGKTNLLDAIYFLSFTKSAFLSSDQLAVKTGEIFFLIKGVFALQNGRESELTASVQNGLKKIFREDQRDYEKLSDHIGKYPAVLMAPDDTDLIREGGESRRKFFDGIISQLDKKYLEDLIQYNHALRQRNSLLKMSAEGKKPDEIALEAYDEMLVKHGLYIFERRDQFINEFTPVFRHYFSLIVAEPEQPSLTYSSQIRETAFTDGLKRSRQKDQVLQRTNFGVHRDDFEFMLKGGEIKKTGSQGQQKSFVIALKLAQAAIIEKYKGFRPILLLDDIFDKLDDDRIKGLIKLLLSKAGQIFVTDARPDRTAELFASEGDPVTTFVVDQGTVIRKS
jgi:DNA replication and repair protein RecF